VDADFDMIKMTKERIRGHARWSIAIARTIGAAFLYALTAGFVLAPVENHLSPRCLSVSEIVYSPMIALYRVCPIYKVLIDWEDEMASKW
jgi:hypothetical protein